MSSNEMSPKFESILRRISIILRRVDTTLWIVWSSLRRADFTLRRGVRSLRRCSDNLRRPSSNLRRFGMSFEDSVSLFKGYSKVVLKLNLMLKIFAFLWASLRRCAHAFAMNPKTFDINNPSLNRNASTSKMSSKDVFPVVYTTSRYAPQKYSTKFGRQILWRTTFG